MMIGKSRTRRGLYTGIVRVCSMMICIVSVVSSPTVSAQLQYIDTSSPNYAQDINAVVDADTLTDGQPLRDGAYISVQSPDQSQDIGIINQGEIQTYGQGQNATLLFVRSLVNYFLGFLGLITLILLMYSGFKVLIAGADDEAYTEAIKTFRKVTIALGGIALSRMIVTFLFYVVGLIVP